ncbi:ATP-dependent Lon protease pim1 [Phlyctochytrium planicorne]|nr:ATP-dependent Lon protease pim1 [Phlyctochytrium planicorne]
MAHVEPVPASTSQGDVTGWNLRLPPPKTTEIMHSPVDWGALLEGAGKGGNAPAGSGGSGAGGGGKPTSPGGGSGSSSGGNSGNGGNGRGRNRSNGTAPPGSGSTGDSPTNSSTSLEKVTVPKLYPQLLAVPLTRRPLFPGFYKSLYIKDPNVIRAIQALVERRQPYVAILLSKDDDSELDTVHSLDEVHKVGVFAQITNVYHAGPDHSALTVVVYPHRRVRVTGIVKPEGMVKEGPKVVDLEDQVDAALAEASAKAKAAASSFSESETVVKLEELTKSEKVEDPVKAPTEVVVEVDSSPNDATATADSPPGATPADATIEDGEGNDVAWKGEGYQPINQHLASYPVSLVNVENQVDQPYHPDNTLVKAITSEMLNVLKEISQLNPLLRDQIITFSIQTGGNAFADPARLADFAAAVSSGESPTELQGVLESLVVEERLHKALVVLKKELANAKLQQEIAKEVDRKITRKQQEYYLMEQLKGIKKELGMESDGKERLVEKFRARAAELKMPEAVRVVFDEEINKLQHLEPNASEFNVTRNYLDWITSIPWGKRSEENFRIGHASRVLDEDHYGLKDVKDRILEFIAVGRLRGTVEGKIVCLVGPPGVGKTSVGKSIARALGREFFRFSVGGLTDVAEIKGHRRTYVGAMPGKVVQALKKVQTENPLVMIDEIDKIGRGHQGDPASALLELLDPEQNSSFLDHYMDIPIDLSKVLFVCTANTLDTIPIPLLDRMEVIQVSGYVSEEKVAIAEKYLAPAAMKSSGLEAGEVEVARSAVEGLIRFYCRESGVRNLKKHIEKVYRKAALKIVREVDSVDETEDKSSVQRDKKTESESEEERKEGERRVRERTKGALVVTAENLKDFVGSPVYTTDRLYETTPSGVVMGLAWTQMGGSALYIESVLESALSEASKPSFHRTGQMGDVMKESSTIAYTFAKSFLAKEYPDNKFFEKASVHLHVPEGATPKDGPSAGVTMATSLISLALDVPIVQDVAMTGELTLTGKILKVGGIKEKTIAAKRSGVTKILLPSANRNDWDELPEYIKEGMDVTFVSWYGDVFPEVFPSK